MEPTNTNNQDGGIGAIVGSVIVVLVIIAGAFYLFTTVQEQRRTTHEQVEQSATPVPADVHTADLEAELESIDTETIDAELTEIEAAL